jgi:hypothetical protein
MEEAESHEGCVTCSYSQSQCGWNPRLDSKSSPLASILGYLQVVFTKAKKYSATLEWK